MKEEWDRLYVWNGVLECSTTGCGCCAEFEEVADLTSAVTIIEEYIQRRKEEIKKWEEWLLRAQEAGKLIE